MWWINDGIVDCSFPQNWHTAIFDILKVHWNQDQSFVALSLYLFALRSYTWKSWINVNEQIGWLAVMVIRCIAGRLWIMDLWSVVHPDTLFVSMCSCRQTSADYTWQTGSTRRWHTFPPATQDVASPVILGAAACRTFTRWQRHSLLDTSSLGNVGVAALWQMPSKCDTYFMFWTDGSQQFLLVYSSVTNAART